MLLDVVEESFAERAFIQRKRDARATELQVRVDALHSARSGRVHFIELLGRAGKVQCAKVGLIPELPMRGSVFETAGPSLDIVAHDMLNDLLVLLQVLHRLLVARNLAGNGEQDIGA